jgi:hypothetical protein
MKRYPRNDRLINTYNSFELLRINGLNPQKMVFQIVDRNLERQRRKNPNLSG